MMNLKEENSLLHPNMLSNHISLDSRFTYSILEKKYIDQVVDVFTRAFCRSEPMTEYLHLDEEKYKIFARAVVLKACQDGLSIVAKEQEKIVACALVEDLAAPGALPEFDPKFHYILALLEQLGESFFSQKTFKKGLIAHLFITAVHHDYRHLGLSKQVNFRAMDLAVQHGFDFVYCELTNIYNEKGIIPHLKNPKRLIGTSIYKDFVYHGIKPFSYLTGIANSYLWSIRPNAKLIYHKDNELVEEELC